MSDPTGEKAAETTGSDRPAADRLAEALAALRSAGIDRPSGSQLADKAGCSKSVANAWKAATQDNV